MLVTNIVHAKPARKGQRDQEQQPDKTGILQIGFGARRNLANQGAAGSLQGHGLATKQAKCHAQRAPGFASW